MVEEITQTVQHMLPYLILRDPDYRMILVVLIPIAIRYLFRLDIKYLCSRGKRVTLTVTRDADEGLGSRNNMSYCHLEQYLVDTIKIDSYICDDTLLKPNWIVRSGDKIRDSCSVIKPDIQSRTIKVPFCKEAIEIYNNTRVFTKGKDNKKTVKEFVLKGSSYQLLRDFLETCKDHHLLHMLKMRAESYLFYNYLNREWHSNKINAVKNFNNVVLELSLYRELIRLLDYFDSDQFHRDCEANGQPKKMSFMFKGPPGCGKTSTILAISNYLKMPIYNIDLSIPSTDGFNRHLYSVPESSILLFDDIDCCKALHQRKNGRVGGSDGESGKGERDGEVNEEEKEGGLIVKLMEASGSGGMNCKLKTMLEFLDGYTSLQRSLVIMTSNYPEKLDSALLRKGRVDHQFDFTIKSAEQREKIDNLIRGSSNQPIEQPVE